MPVLLMIGMIPLIANDYLLAAIDLIIIFFSLSIKRYPRDFIVLVFGFTVLTISEWIFVSTGVETFTRRTLFGIMPIWLPVLWGYAFVAIKRAVLIL